MSVNLLVSVRSRQEAAAALAGGADIIDIKEPSQGSLGRAAASVMDTALYPYTVTLAMWNAPIPAIPSREPCVMWA